ncbi:iron-containing alcohol dehydrogenase [uncultured Granulicatella sp.]|uniref:iron-containing alcohol dehydrogenase n=1 Tax=uncultured Granulicatella sp. TaxID=316089 RepID=UPI00261FB157|nr:iron-containing alcohol dehydrogenase [uncultured Granulicatella sp.]
MENSIQNFTFQNPTKILFGKNRIEEIDNEIPKYAKVLILYGGGSVKKNGAFDRAVSALGGRDWDEFSGIEANPTFETLMKAVHKVREGGFTYLLAIGGGSVIDGTKFVSAASLFEGDPIDLFGWGIGKGLPVQEVVPFGTILTLPATGSEMNSGAVISFVEKNAKVSFRGPKTFPVFSVLEPELTYTLPERQLVNGLLDSFIHVMENYLTYPVGGILQDRYAESILQTLIEIAPRIIDIHHIDYNDRATFMWCATNALNGTINLGVPTDWSSHALGHEITLNHGLDHGRTLSIVLPAMMKVRKNQKWDKLVQYGKRVWGLHGEDDEIVEQAIINTEKFFSSLGAPTRFSDVGLDEEVIPALLEGLKRHKKTSLSEHDDVTPEVAYEVYKTAL